MRLLPKSRATRRAASAVLRAGVILLTTLSMVALTQTVTAPRARAADNGVTDLLAVLGVGGGSATLASWTAGLGAVGRLAEPLPLISASPGGLLGLTDFFGRAVTDQLAAAVDFGDLEVDRDIEIGSGRAGHLSTSVSDFEGGKRLDILATVHKSVGGQALHISSADPKVELSVAEGTTVELRARFALSLVWTGATEQVYVLRKGDTPRLDVDAYASTDDTTAKAAIGILGVSLTGSDVNVHAHLVATVSDPDGDGKLFFTKDSPLDGELARPGSLEGLVSVDLDAQGSLPIDDSHPGSRGAVHATLQLGAAATGVPVSLPVGVSATVRVDWPDIGVGSPTVSAPDLALTVGKFQNLSLQDLAAGIAQVIASITAIQKSRFDPDGDGPLPTVGDLDLPFMKGTLADAIKINELLKAFLQAHTVPAPGEPEFEEGVTDPAQAGQPTFTSLQDLLRKLDEDAGINLGDIGWDSTTSKLTFTLGMSKAAPGAPVALDPVSSAASGASGQYGPRTLTVPGAGWTPNQWLGRRVQAGTSAGEVEGNTADTITLKADWIGGQPANTTPYVVSGDEAHVGAVTLANRVEDGSGHGIVNANSDQTFAKVTPSFQASLTLVLDLQDARTGDACIGFMGSTQACPFVEQDGQLRSIVESLPRNADRVLIRTGGPLFSADFPIETAVDLTANAGFFKVRLNGQLRVCNSAMAADCASGTPSGHMLTIGLRELGDAQHDLRLGALLRALIDDPASLLDIDVNIRAHGQLTVSLPDAQDFLPSGATAEFTIGWADVVDPSSITIDTTDLAEIFRLDFDAADPKALFTALIKTLQTLAEQLAGASTSAGSGVFDTEIPGLGRSLRDLLLSDESNGGPGVSYGAATLTDQTRSGSSLFRQNLVGRTVVVGTQVAVIKEVSADGRTLTMASDWQSLPAAGTPYTLRSALDDAIDQLLTITPDNIQDAVKLLNRVLGNDSIVKFRYLDVGGVGHLVLDLDWKREYRTAAPVRLALGNVDGSDRTFASAQATGMAQVDATGRVRMGLAVPLVTSAGPVDGLSLKVLEDSSITVGARASLTDGVVKGTVGPLSIALGNPTDGAPAAERAQVRADLSLALGKPSAAADTPVSFSDFIGAVGVDFNATNGTVDCGEGLSTALMVCSRLPLYLNNTGLPQDWAAIGQIALRVPDSTNPADLIDLDDTLPAPDDTKRELEIPADLGTKLGEAILDFGNLGDGLDGYLAQIEAAFRLASFQGRLPLIGDDLQKGADFIGRLRATLRESIWGQLPGAGRPATAAAFRDFINAQLDEALAEVDIAAVDVSVAFDCGQNLQPAAAPTLTPTIATADPPLDTAQWQYRVVAYQGSGDGTAGDTLPSTEGSATGAATLDAASFNTLTWAAVTGATGYKILRKAAGETEFTLLTKLGAVLQYADNGSATPSAYTPVTTAPQLDACPLDFINGVFLEFTAQRGIVSAAAGCTSAGAPKPCIGDSVALDIGIPGLALRQGSEGTDGISYELGFALHFRLGLTKTDGFFVNTHDGWGPDGKARPELQVGLAFDLPDTMVAELAFIKINVAKAQGQGHDPSRKLFAGAFQLDLRASVDEASCFVGDEQACTADDTKKILFAELGGRPISDLFAVSLTGRFHIDWSLQAEIDSAFPGVRANFQLMWEFNNRAPEAAGPPTIRFKDIGISAGTFFEGLLGDAIKEMKRVTGPIQPVLDTLYAPIPILSDLSRLAGGGDVTLISMAKAYSTLKGGPRLDFIDTIRAIVEFIHRLPTCNPTVANDCYVLLGEFEVDGDKALATSNSPTTADKLYKTQTPASGAAVKSALNTANDNAAAAGKPVFGSDPQNKGDAEKAGFSFPILDNPSSAFNLLMGGDVTLVEFDSGPLTLGFVFDPPAMGPVYAPPPVYITLYGAASVSLRIVAGLDTYGLRKAVEAVRNGTKLTTLNVLDGLFFKTVDDNGVPIPVVRLDGEIAVGAEVSLFIIKVGIEGGLRLFIGFFWNDPNKDGKFRVSEFLHAALNNPVCLFTMSGKLSFFLRLTITIGFSIFKKKFKITLADVTLLEFSAKPDCEPPPPKLGGTVGDTLVVFAGKFGTDDFRGHPVWDNTAESTEKDLIKVISLHYEQTAADPAGTNGDFDGFAVQLLGERREYLDPNLRRVVVDGGGTYPKPMIVSFTGDGKKETGAAAGSSPSVFDKDAVVIGGAGADVITAGRGLSYVDGRGGDDVIVTGDLGGASSSAWVAGGPGRDSIGTGNGGNRVAGDASLGAGTRSVTVTHNAQDGGGTSSLSGVFDWQAPGDPTTAAAGPDQGDDSISVGLGANTVLGNGGADVIGVASDPPGTGRTASPNVLVGGEGSDQITGGSAADRIFTAAGQEFGVDDAGPADPGATNVVDTGAGSDEVWGSTGVDLVTSHSSAAQTARLRGGDGEDVLSGGFGTDEVYGGPGDDYVIAEPAEVSEAGEPDGIFGPLRSVLRLPLPAGVTSSAKILVGGLGNDHIIGGDGPATMFGDRRIDAEACVAGVATTSDPVAESGSPATGDGNDRILGGAGVDTLSAGGATDVAELFGGDDLGCGQQGDDLLRGGAGTDHLWGGGGVDTQYGDAGTDRVFGNAGDDQLYGGADADLIEGNDGADWATGGADGDLLYGGTRLPGRPDGADTLSGDAGIDRLIGDNGSATLPAVPHDLDGLTPSAGAGDTIHGGTDDDTAFGGLGNDAVNGGDDADHLEGNNGVDTVHGDAGEDAVVGGSFELSAPGTGRSDDGDILFGDSGADLLAGDNAVLTVVADPAASTPVTRERGFALNHSVLLLDLGLSPAAGVSGSDLMSGGTGQDVLYAQAGTDRARGDGDDDYVEGGQGVDWVEGDAGSDDLVGGSSTVLAGDSGQSGEPGQLDGPDALFGGPGDDVVLGDNGVLLRPAAGQTPSRVTLRLSASGATAIAARIVQEHDLTAAVDGRHGDDRISGGSGVDLLWGQDGGDYLSGGGQADYLEGNGAADVLRGDLPLSASSAQTIVVPLPDPGWPGTPGSAEDLEGSDPTDGQDDLIGGSSAAGLRDGPDAVQGDGADDVVLGDNGSLLRTLQGAPGSLSERVYTQRYPTGAVPADATVARTHDPDLPGPSTRFCTEAQATCEPVGAFGADTLFGDGGNDGLWGQDGDDTLAGGDGDDDVLGELGADTLFGNAGRDALLGDRGGVVNEYLNADDVAAHGFTVSLSSVPQESYTGFRAGAYDRRVDLLHDVDGDTFLGAASAAAMPHDAITTGGDDRIRGGSGDDNIHAGWGDDLANGDSGGDQLFGADGADVLWGGKGCDPVLDAATPDCLVNGVFAAQSRGLGDRFVDHVFGGTGGTSAASDAGALGSDVIDFNPRGAYPGNCAAGPWPVSLGTSSIDPCRWFELTDKANDSADPATLADNQHHHGTDWVYGGWDRDVLQADQAANGPNPGDRLMDWNGSYNLFTHCNAAYGGFNDIRQHSPAMRDFLQKLGWASGAGQTASDVTTAGTSAFREIAISYSEDIRDHAAGQAYPGTPGHFDSPVSCSD